MHGLLALAKPVVWLFKRLTDGLFKLLGLPDRRDDAITPDDILAMAQAGAEAGVIRAPEHLVIENVMELDSRYVPMAMTPRDRVVHLLLDDSEALIRAKIIEHPHSTYLVCDGDIDHVVGYLDSKDLLNRILKQQPINLQAEGLIKKVLIVPDRLNLSEMLGQFRQAYEDYAVVVNEYALVVGIITLNDVMNTVMGSLMAPVDEDLIVQRDADSWLIDGVTPIPDVLKALNLYSLPQQDEYETLAGFLMVMLRRVPRRTDRLCNSPRCRAWGGNAMSKPQWLAGLPASTGGRRAPQGTMCSGRSASSGSLAGRGRTGTFASRPLSVADRPRRSSKCRCHTWRPMALRRAMSASAMNSPPTLLRATKAKSSSSCSRRCSSSRCRRTGSTPATCCFQ